MNRYTYSNNGEIEIRLDLTQSASPVQYRLLNWNDERWLSTPFQRAEFASESDALETVSEWIEVCGTN